jgi:antitoxin PrlF
VNITSKGQVTIPHRIRRRCGLKPGTQVEFVLEGDKVVLRPKRKGTSAADAWVAEATGVLKGRTTAGIMRLTRGES